MPSHRKPLTKRIPVISEIVRFLERRAERKRLRAKSVEAVFTDVYASGEWVTKESVSGIGSELESTRHLVSELPRVLSSLGVKSMLDIPCGDFLWMKEVDLSGVAYTGADIVHDLVARNQERYGSPTRTFQHLNLISDPLPAVDLVLCRDCLVHLEFARIFQALANVCASGSTYLLMTTFPDRKKNKDIVTGRWRTLNFEIAPFRLPAPVRVVSEEYDGEGGKYRDKSLGLWRIESIRDQVARLAR
jgi:hypothetical protein